MATEIYKGKRAKSTSPEALLKDIHRNTKLVFSSGQKVLIVVMEGIVGSLVRQSCATIIVLVTLPTINGIRTLSRQSRPVWREISMRCGQRTLPTSKLKALASITFPQSWTTIVATSFTGSFVARYLHRMSHNQSTKPCLRPD